MFRSLSGAVLAVCLALIAAFLYALGTVLQQKADVEEADPAGIWPVF